MWALSSERKLADEVAGRSQSLICPAPELISEFIRRAPESPTELWLNNRPLSFLWLMATVLQWHQVTKSICVFKILQEQQQ